MWLRAKASWVKRAGLVAVALLLFSNLPISFADVVSTTVDTSMNVSTGTCIENQRCVIYNGSRYWIFYYNGTDVVYKSTTNLATFSSKTSVFNSTKTPYDGALDVHIYSNNTFVYLVSSKSFNSGAGSINEIWFRKGTISGASITWSTAVLVANITTALFNNHFIGSITVSYDGTTFFIGPSELGAGFTFGKYKSTDGGVTWSSADASTSYGESLMLPMTANKAMFIRAYVFDASAYLWSQIYSGGVWGGNVVVYAKKITEDTNHAYFSAINDPSNNDIIYLVWLNDTGATHQILYSRYNSGWGAPEIVQSGLTGYSWPVITYDNSSTSLKIAWIQGNLLYQKTRNSDGSYGSATLVVNETSKVMASPKSLSASPILQGGKIVYLYETGSGVPYNATIAILSIVNTTTTTSTTATVTTLTTQTTTADTIVDAVANQFAAIMENLFPALIIILVFVYLAYKAGASGEVLAYVFIITLVLTSFVNLMPWWITVIVSVIMIAILLNYRQRGGGVPQ